MKKKYLSLIEELNPNSNQLTDDPDIAAKQNEVVNQIQFKLARFKKIAKYVDIPVTKGQLVTFEDIGAAVGYDVYQLGTVGGVKHEQKANGTVLKILETGTLEVDCFVYPERITDSTKDKAYEFELSQDAQEIMPYGIAADLLASDASSEYGKVYADKFREELQLLDMSNNTISIYIEGGVL